MRSLFRCLSFVVLGIALARPGVDSRAGEPAPALPAGAELAALQDRTLELLASEKDADRAWGAYLAGKHGIAAAVPRLLELAGEEVAGEEKGKRAVQSYAVAALTDLRPAVDEATIRRFLDRREHALALALLAADPESGQKLLLDLVPRGDAPDVVWVAVCNLLLDERPGGFAAGLVRATHVRLRVTVIDGPPLDGGDRRWASQRFGDGHVDFGGEFPPVVRHTLELRPRNGDVLLATGPRNVYLRRCESKKNGRLGFGGSSSPVDRYDYRLDCLAELLCRRREDLGVHLSEPVVVEWKGPDKMREQLAASVRAILGAWESLADDLAGRGLITAEEQRGLRPTLSIEVSDLRKDTAKPLPAVDDLVSGEEVTARKPDVF